MTPTTETIWKAFHQELFNFINKRVNDKDVSKDILQDVFIKIHLKIGTLSDKDKLASWVYQITRNSIMDHFRKQKTKVPLTDQMVELEEEKVFNAELVKCLKPMIDQLPGDYKDAILQTEMGSLSQKEYAEKSGISYSGAKSRVQRARQQLHSLFHECCSIESDKYGNITDHECKKDCGCKE
ncbi:MAG: sigma-70 family polymerase sigma factor [Bacteroidota bacterium]|jgi:RNA polymerase sigma-70 factor (ECF subfamily)|nr:sigma-70 family polymerase sigma factor [Bacteroidota bacterium]